MSNATAQLLDGRPIILPEENLMARRRSRRAQADYGHFSVTVSASSAYGQRKGAAAKTARGDAAARSRGRLGVCRGGSAASKFPGTGL